ncbi:hypothetical protein H4R33_004110 [Dimargaris cristalligena]|uniref:Uncharacterized protein n=1 Tax=Dimargaris cristalligena TaxID=215637 RepID=A0A4V1J418_9FUNG|nr:hypothetical protein H4R33_004110 [Dimargaris cristalligena]RKP34009.1 hypothetical protein BJ085DRAFT_41093 [Dimargaris cristalligena]|eukprot:RKP34009.1 hypothetical protein BJ085DRAFT_41093 [Dimargaris cristalligena]
MADDPLLSLKAVRATLQGLESYLHQVVKDLETMATNYQVLADVAEPLLKPLEHSKVIAHKATPPAPN